MPAWMLFYLIPAVVLPHLPSLPSTSFCWLALIVGGLCWRVAPWFMALLLGIAWTGLAGQTYLNDVLPINLEKREISTEACVSGLLKPFDGGYRRVELDIVNASLDSKRLSFNGRVIVGDYQGWPLLAGECFAMRLKLKRPHSLHNFSLPDRGALTVANGTLAQGYITYVGESLGSRSQDIVLRWRSYMQAMIIASPLDAELQGLLAALVLGDKGLLSDEQWRDSRRSGTVHLLVVSGLHIGLLAMSGYWLVFGLAGLWPRSYRLLSRQHQAWIGAWIFGGLFALLSGWGLPAQRAVIMLSVAVWFRLAHWGAQPWMGWGVACLIVLLLQPMASLSLGFWLSFGLVASLIAGASGGSWWRQLLVAQGRCMAFSTPLLWWQLGGLSVVAPIINLVIVPAMSLFLPLLIVGFLGTAVSDIFWVFLQGLLEGIHYAMRTAATPSWSYFAVAEISEWGLLLLAIGVSWLLSPAWVMGRPLGLLLILVVPWITSPKPPAGMLMHVFDVGQGSAVLLQSRQYAGLYDTGPRFGDYTVMEAQILPAMRRMQVHALDYVWVSHRDSDHSGGWSILVNTLPVGEALLSDNGGCYQGRQWQLGDLAVTALWPPQHHDLKKSNNRSCTLLIEVAGVRILLPGDIEASVERALLKQGLPTVDVLLVPHHGSKTSSSTAFVDALQPRYIIVESGYANRYGHPHEQVLARYFVHGAELLWTARDGAIRVSVSGRGKITVSSSRQERPSFWH